MLILSPSHPSSHPFSKGPTFRWPAMPGPPQSHQWEAEICGVTTAFESWLNGVLNKNRGKTHRIPCQITPKNPGL